MAIQINTTPTSRRHFLAVARNAAVAAIGASAAGLLVAAPRTLSAIIERHRAAYRDVEALFGLGEPDDDEFSRLSGAEGYALDELCAFRPGTIEEARLRSDYLVGFLRQGALISPDQFTDLVASFASTPLAV